MGESLFQFLFKYRPALFERGEVSFAMPARTATIVLAILAVGALVAYLIAPRGVPRRDRLVLGALRAMAVAILVLVLMRPTLLLSSAVPQRNILAILIDDSRSMRIADGSGAETRAAAAGRIFAEDSALARELSDRFILRYYRFGESASPLDATTSLDFDAPRTRVGAALDRVRRDLSSTQLAGVVVVTDGADNSRGQVADAIQAYADRGIPIHTVGLGAERLEKDVQLTRADVPRRVLAGAGIAAELLITHRGFAGQKARVVAEDGGRIVAAEEVTLPRDGEPIMVPLHVKLEEPGARVLRFRVVELGGERVRENNAREALVMVRDRREKILYVEGEPRFEMKFARIAVGEDKNLQLVTLQRTGKDKYLRLSLDDSLELLTGFPRTRRELYKYRAIILGSIEASAFTHDQLRMIADFVSERGGGLLALGGPFSLAEGGYAGTPVADVLPVMLEGSADTTRSSFSEVRVEPTPAGRNHAVTQLAASTAASAERWKTLPPLTSVNRSTRFKPGATPLLVGITDNGQRRPVLVTQPFGRGRSAVLGVQDSWLWQMHADITVEDQTHETLWRQMLRWLVAEAPDRAETILSDQRVAPGEMVTLRAAVADSDYMAVNDARVTARVTSPAGEMVELPMDWSVERDGEYRASFIPTADGIHEVAVEARQGAEVLRADTSYLWRGTPTDEWFDAGLRTPLLTRMARETGGKSYTPSTVGSLPDDAMYTRSGATITRREDLWDMPVVFVLLVTLMGAEWGWRRWRGLA